MAGSADDEDQRGREIEEGEIEDEEVVSAGSGSDTDTDDEDARYYLQPHRGPGGMMSPASSFGSDGNGTFSVARGAGFPCHVCRREFTSWKAVHGHMRVHALPQPAPKEVAASGGSTGGASAVEEVGDSMAIVVAAQPKVSDDTTTPVQSVGSNNPVVNGGSSGGSSARSSVEPSQTGAAAPAPEQVPVVAPTPPAPPQQPAAAGPQQATYIPLMAPAAAPQQATYIPLMVPAASQRHIVARSDPTAAGRGFSCRECGRWFPTHQGLGGHVAGHKNRRLAAEAAAAAAAGIDPLQLACRGGARAERSHACKICGAEYPSGVSLGGHMRKHYSGKPIVPRKRMRLGAAELALALPLQRAPPAVEAPIDAPPVQVPPGCLRLFGVTIVQQAKEEEAEEEEEHPVEESTASKDL